MTQPQQQFLELLTSGLWGRPADTALFKGNVDWQSIYRIAVEQAVQVVVADGIETLPKEFWPPKEVLMKFMIHQKKNMNLQKKV